MISVGSQVHLMQLVAVNVYEAFGTIILSSYQFKVADEHAAKDGTILQNIMSMQ